jgi:hypothetical protein
MFVLAYSPEKQSDGLGNRFGSMINDRDFVIYSVEPAIRKNQQDAEDQGEDQQVMLHSAACVELG